MGVCLIIRTSGGTDTSGATATAARVLSGYTCYVNDVKITGTMANQGTKTASLNAGGSYTIPAGYHSGSGKVTANALSGQTSGTATAARILSGRTAWVNGSKLTGTMTNRGAISQKLAANGNYTVPAGWHNGSGKVTQSLTTQGGKTVTPTTSNQTACAANRWTTGNIVVAGNANLKAANIKNGITIFGIRGTFTGWVDSTINVFSETTGTVNSNFGNWFFGSTQNHTLDLDDMYIGKHSSGKWMIMMPAGGWYEGSIFCFKVPGVSGTTPKSGTIIAWAITPGATYNNKSFVVVWYFNTNFSYALGAKVQNFQFKYDKEVVSYSLTITGSFTYGDLAVSEPDYEWAGTGTWTGWVGISTRQGALSRIGRIEYHP